MRVVVKFAVPGVHYWANAPERYHILRNPHRHMFHFKVAMDTLSDDRETEILWLRDECIDYLKKTYLYEPSLLFSVHQFCGNSCEALACSLGRSFLRKIWPSRHVTVQCLEDNENGAVWDSEEERDD